MGSELRILRRRLVVFFLISVAAVSGALGLLLALGLIDVWSAVQITALAVLCGLVVLLAIQVRRTAAQIRQLRRVLDRQVREVAEIAGENRAELFGRADDLTARLDTVAESVAEVRTEIRGRMSEVQVLGSAQLPTRAAS
jgi:ABC-type transport system involved in cytochrome bd biosynthesis fused ATPase/permease subunit